MEQWDSPWKVPLLLCNVPVLQTMLSNDPLHSAPLDEVNFDPLTLGDENGERLTESGREYREDSEESREKTN